MSFLFKPIKHILLLNLSPDSLFFLLLTISDLTNGQDQIHASESALPNIMAQIPQQPTSSLSIHVKAHRNYVGGANQFISGRKRIFNCKARVEGKQTMQNARLNQILIVKCNLPVLWRIISDAVDSILNEAVELSQNKTKWSWNLHTSDLRKGKFRFISLAHCGGKNMIFIMG